ncbi:MAG: alanine--glyoxylate aminotransferase family protein [Polyangiales bacterium]
MTERRLLMIPGPIELEPEVLRALGTKTRGHLDPDFMALFGRALQNLREVFHAPAAQPFVVAGSGTLAMELAAMNVVEPGEAVLVVDTGWFSDRMARILDRLGAEVVRVSAPPGSCPDPTEVERLLGTGRFAAMTLTHVDTSTGVRIPLEAFATVARAHGVLTIVDGVCSVGGEELRQEAWGLDVVLTGSQKALGVPPGLAVVLASPRALFKHRARRTPVPSLYVDFAEWLPVMEAYEAGRPAYFATPAVNLITALDASLLHLVAEGMEPRIARHARLATAMRAGLRALGLELLPSEESLCASTLSAIRYPKGVDASLVGRMRDEGIVVAGGLLPELKGTYFRIGHMGAHQESDVLAVLGALERALDRSGVDVDLGSGLGAAQSALLRLT